MAVVVWMTLLTRWILPPTQMCPGIICIYTSISFKGHLPSGPAECSIHFLLVFVPKESLWVLMAPFFTGLMFLLSLSQQHQSTEVKSVHWLHRGENHPPTSSLPHQLNNSCRKRSRAGPRPNL